MSTHPTGLPNSDGPQRCGDCAWRDEAGRCVFAAIGEAPGPEVSLAQRACAFHEPRVECDPCGACCREAFDSVPVTEDDAVRLGAERAAWVRTHDDGWRDLVRVPSPLGCGTRCGALRGDGALAQPYRCVIYELRPTNCRELERGSEGCLTARRRVGLTPLAPGQSPEGPLSVR